MIQTTVVGGYPKILDDQKLRKTLWKVDRGEAGADEIERVCREVSRSAIREQEEAGIDLISDGQIRWEDNLNPVAKGLRGFDITGLVRLYDTNVLYRRPVATGEVEWESPILVEDFKRAQADAKKPLKMVITGPFTMAKLSKDEHYRSEERFVMAIAEALNAELRALCDAGAKQLHLNEHSFTKCSDEAGLFKQAIGRAVDGISSGVTVYLSFGDATPVLGVLEELPVETVGIDLTYSPGALDALASGKWSKPFLAGLIDARNTKLESRDEIHRALDSLTRSFSSKRLSISPSASLEFLPLDRCRTKMKNMCQIAHAYGG